MFTEQELLSLGFGLEADGMSHEEIDAYFEHHGVKGMHWGIRRGSTKTGVSRAGGALMDVNRRKINNIELAKQGDRFKTRAAIARVFIGKEQQKENWNSSIKALRNQNARIKAGQSNIHDKINMGMKVPVIDFAVRRIPGDAK